MNTTNPHKRFPSHYPKLRHSTQTGLINRMIKSVIGGLIGLILAEMLGMISIAFIVKAFLFPDANTYQLLNTAITLIGGLLGAALGYLLGKSSNG